MPQPSRYAFLLASVGAVAMSAASGACGAFSATDASSPPPPDGGADAGERDATSDAAVVDDAAPTDGASDAARDGAVSFGPPCNGSTTCDRVVFVTNRAWAPSFGNVTTADAICQTAADSSSNKDVRARTFKAWLSDVSQAPLMSFAHGTGKYLRTDGELIIIDWNALTTGKMLEHPIQMDENGDAVIGAVWTATNFNGTLVTGSAATVTCNGWTTPLAGSQAVTGSTSEVSTAWTVDAPANTSCSAMAHLYCFEQ